MISRSNGADLPLLCNTTRATTQRGKKKPVRTQVQCRSYSSRSNPSKNVTSVPPIEKKKYILILAHNPTLRHPIESISETRGFSISSQPARPYGRSRLLKKKPIFISHYYVFISPILPPKQKVLIKPKHNNT